MLFSGKSFLPCLAYTFIWYPGGEEIVYSLRFAVFDVFSDQSDGYFNKPDIWVR